jgi:hypothetical protein
MIAVGRLSIIKLEKKMKLFLRKNYEKLLLVILLLTLTVSAISTILQERPPFVGPPEVGSLYHQTILDDIRIKPVVLKEDNGALTPGSYIYCPDSKCNYLVHKSEDKCPWCRAIISKEQPVRDDDINKNNISDALEISWGLDLNDDQAIYRDPDGDGFRTFDEHVLFESPVDSESHPSLLKRCRFKGIENRFVPVKVLDVQIITNIPGVEVIYVDGTDDKKRSFYLGIGEKVNGREILDAGVIDGRGYAEFEIAGERMRLWAKSKTSMPGWPKYIIEEELSDEVHIYKVVPGEEFFIRSRGDVKYKYKFIDFDSANRRMNIRENDKEDFYLGEEAELEKPVK